MSARTFSRGSTQIRREIDALLATADQGRIFREGVRVVIYGATNAGKSSLLNRLLGFPARDRERDAGHDSRHD